MSQIKAKLCAIILLLLSVIMLIPAASSKYVRSYPIDLTLKTVLSYSRLFWTDKTGSEPNLVTLANGDDDSPTQAGYYMIIAKGGNGGDSAGTGGYGGVVAAIFEYDPSSDGPIKIALGTSASSSSCGYNALDSDSDSALGVFRGGACSDAEVFGGAATAVYIGDTYGFYDLSYLALIAAGGGGGDPTESYAGGAGGSNVLSTGANTYDDDWEDFVYFYGQDGLGDNAGYGGRHQADNDSLAGEQYEGGLYCGNGGPLENGSAYICGGAGFVGGYACDSGGAGGGSSVISRNCGYYGNATSAEFIAKMSELLSSAGNSVDGVPWPSGVTMNSSGYLCNSNGTYSDISFVGIYYMGTSLS